MTKSSRITSFPFSSDSAYDSFCYLFLIDPLNPNLKSWTLNNYCCPYLFPTEKLIKYQAKLILTSCVIMSIILMTTLFYKVLILQGEIWCWSLLGCQDFGTATLSTSLFSLWSGRKVWRSAQWSYPRLWKGWRVLKEGPPCFTWG